MYVALLIEGAFVQKKIVFLPGESTVATPDGKKKISYWDVSLHLGDKNTCGVPTSSQSCFRRGNFSKILLYAWETVSRHHSLMSNWFLLLFCLPLSPYSSPYSITGNSIINYRLPSPQRSYNSVDLRFYPTLYSQHFADL